ncbi:MAG: hypothetical protein M1827_006898 [Pycnora praestabilis]|nr:MAG: hypothetical protein M1827_006898 [Pycnora praestabilis]
MAQMDSFLHPSSPHSGKVLAYKTGETLFKISAVEVDVTRTPESPPQEAQRGSTDSAPLTPACIAIDSQEQPSNLKKQYGFFDKANGELNDFQDAQVSIKDIGRIKGESVLDHSVAPPPRTDEQLAEDIVDVLERYRISARDKALQAFPGRSSFLAVVKERVESNKPVHMVLPAFPFKSPNKHSKVLGALPDKAEEVALTHLNGLGNAIENIYPGGAKITIVSDGLMYNDILGVSDKEVWEYSQAVRRIASEHQLTHICFSRVRDLINLDEAEGELTKEQWLSNVPLYRSKLYDEHISKSFDASKLVAKDPDAAMTYRGYIKFLEKDLEYTEAYERDVAASQIKRRNEGIAKQMMGRGKAFANAIAHAFPHSIRLSIHPSTETTKLSISITPQAGDGGSTPWHSSLVRALDGSVKMSHALHVPAKTHDLIYENGRPSYFREKSDLFTWPDMDVVFEYLYPIGVLIKPRNQYSGYSLQNVHMQKVRQLAEHCSPVILRGFMDTTDRRTFIAKAHDAGEVKQWNIFGVLAEVKDIGIVDKSANNVVSSEPLPMHFDGMFKFTIKTDDNGNEISVNTPPNFQYFTAVTTSPPGSGYTLFASSRLFWQNLPKSYTVKDLSKITWSCRNSGFWESFQEHQPLVVPHPTKGYPCLRWHEPWPQWKTKFAHCEVNIENGSQDIIPLVGSLLYDHRVCLYFTWQKGDILVNDNVSMLHTRTAFDGACDRELWRIHFD